MDKDDIEMILNPDNPTSNLELNECEQKIISDISECKRSKLVGTICKVKVNDYKKINNGKFELIIDFISYFSAKFIFDSDYPISPPSIIYNNGKKIANIMDNNANILVESIKKENWNKGIWLSTLIFSIELLISRETSEENNKSNSNKNLPINKKEKYGKRKWEDYIKEEKELYESKNEEMPELENNTKRIKQ